MKKLFTLITFLTLSVSTSNLFAQDKELDIETEINGVTVYTEGAQISRNKKMSVEKGKTTYKFTGLSPYIDAKSVQVKVEGKLTVLSVRHQFNFLDEKKKSEELEELSEKTKDIEEKIQQASTELDILSEEMLFLRDNRSIGGANTGVDIEELRKADAYYSERLAGLKSKESKKNREIRELKEELIKIRNQMKSLNEKTDLPSGEILVEVSADAKVTGDFELSYMVGNAGWYPSYDVRVKTISDPLNVIYKANVYQNTNVDWENVPLKFSSANPSTSGVAPKLQTYYVGYNSWPPVYDADRRSVSVTYNDRIGQVFGTVYDMETNEPLIGANVVVKGTSIGAVADESGRYSLTLPPNAEVLVFNYIGYETQQKAITSETVNAGMKISSVSMDAVIVTSNSDNWQTNYFEELKLAESADMTDEGRYYALKSEMRAREERERLGEEMAAELSRLEAEAKSMAYAQERYDSRDKRVSGYYESNRAGLQFEQNLRSIPVDAVSIEYQTNFEFEIKTPYTIPSNGKSLSIEVKDYTIEATYHYYSIPKIEKEAYLTAFIRNWDQYNFMEGEANVFVEGTYIGKTLIDTRYLTDSLEISLGKDKNVMVGREIQKEFVSKQFLRSKKEEARAWLITVRNNKKQEINITVLDQVPVSNSSSVSVDHDELSGAQLDQVTGEVKWELKIKPQEQTSKLLKYKVKYPDYWNTVIE